MMADRDQRYGNENNFFSDFFQFSCVWYFKFLIAFRAILDNQDHRADQENVDRKGTKDQEAFRELQDLLVLLERMAFRDILESVDHR